MSRDPDSSQPKPASRKISRVPIPARDAKPKICLAAAFACRTIPFAVKNMTPQEMLESTAALMFSEVLARRRSS